MTGITLKVSGINDLNQNLARMATRAKDLTPAMRSIGARQVRETEKNFRAGGRPKKWKKSNRAKRDGGLTLTKTGRLRRSVSWKADKRSVAVGTNTAYAAAHQFGFRGTVNQSVRSHTRRTGGKQVKVKAHRRKQKQNLPARPYIVVTPADRKAMGQIVHKHLGVR